MPLLGAKPQCSNLLAMETAPFGRRLAALCADWALSYFAAAFFASLGWGSVSALQLVVFYFEVIAFTAITGASVGQQLMKLRIVSFETGGYLPFQKVLIRTTLLILVLPALFSANGRGFHDILAKSAVVKAINA